MAYRWLNDLSQQFLERDYLLEGQTVDERVDVICNTAERILKKSGFAAKFKKIIQNGWCSLSSPIWTNFGTERGFGISCFGSHIDDSMQSIVYTWSEVSMMTKHGGGTSAYFGNLRPRGSKIKNNGSSSGSVHFMQAFENLINIVSQGATRRGNFAAYLPIDHADIEEFLKIRTEGFPIQSLSYGVCVPDYWMEEMIAGDMAKRRIWAKVLESRTNLGFPYIFFTDNANKGAPDCYKGRYPITHSNLCCEIMEPDNESESFVCDLLSLNILYFDEWKNTDAIECVVYFLDAVMSEFIEKAKKIGFMERAVRFAENHRALGIGWLGWHSYLQSKMIAFESMEAKLLNTKIAKTIKEQAYAASAKMAEEYGEPEVCKGFGRRNATLMAIAPTKSSAFILGQVSETIQPDLANICIKDLQKGKYTIKNKYLEALLEEKGKNTEENWQDILKHGGSVQHVSYLNEHEKDVFKTFAEISQREIILQAAQRQKYIDQGQSLNIMIHPSVPAKDLNTLMIEGWRLGIKSFYYQISVNAAQSFSRNILACRSCEG
jgi:ribonucleoside-diphosphate reductase alpha chain